MDGLAKAAGHEDRRSPLKSYCKGLLLPGDRKSIEPMAARLDPCNVEPLRQSLHHLVAKAPWRDEEIFAEVRNRVLPAIGKHGPVVAWIVDDMIRVSPRRASIRWGWRASIADKWENRRTAGWR